LFTRAVPNNNSRYSLIRVPLGLYVMPLDEWDCIKRASGQWDGNAPTKAR
jgi:hypothetical protein